MDTSETRIATLALPTAGSYLIWSKVYLQRRTAGQATEGGCWLRATGNIQDLAVSAAVQGLSGEIVNTLAHDFNGPVTVNLYCNASGQSTAYEARIVAIKVGKLTTSAG